ncbi:MAG: hypothetical protein HQL41_18020 [Alphaproteobacteria bacterium]|nr:hypothetical protein [Alphaproteobacteria bacterium]
MPSNVNPWLDRFAAQPDAALADLLAGEAWLPGLQRATACQALEVLFGDLPRQPAPTLWNLLDESLLAWLQSLKDCSDALIERPGGLRRFVTEASEGFRAVHRMELPRCSAWLETAFPELLGWAGRFVETADFDLVQSVMGAVANVQTDDRYRFVWLRACSDAANRRLRHRIDTALPGLASMPGDGAMPRQEVLLGLVRWGERLDPKNDHRAAREFQRRVRQIKAAFPHARDFWLERWGGVLARKDLAPHVQGWLGEVWPELKDHAARRHARVPVLPDNVRDVVDGLNERWCAEKSPGLLDEMESFLALLERYALATGDTFRLPASSVYLCRVVRDGAPGHGLAWMRRVLLWAPNNDQAWSLRADCLVRLGRAAEAEAVLWEAERRLPHNGKLRHQLAHLLALRGADTAAEWLLRGTVEENRHSRDELARLLWRTGRGGEAVDLLERFVRLHSDDPVTLYTLAMLYIAEGRNDRAAASFDSYMSHFGLNEWAKILERLLAAGAGGRDEARRHLAPPSKRVDRDAFDADAAARALAAEEADAPLLRRRAWGAEADLHFRMGDAPTAERIAGRALAEDADDTLATVVMALGSAAFRGRLRGRLDCFAGLLPVRLAALAGPTADEEAWGKLRHVFTDPDERGLIDLAQAGLAGGGAERDLMEWAERPTRPDDPWTGVLKDAIRRPGADFVGLARDALLEAVDPGTAGTLAA